MRVAAQDALLLHVLLLCPPSSQHPTPASPAAVPTARFSAPPRRLHLLLRRHSMISWADPDLISKKEWDREYAQPIMAGALRVLGGVVDVVLAAWGLLRHARVHACACVSSRRCSGSYHVRGNPSFYSEWVGSPNAGQLPDASAHEVKTMNRRLAVFHDLTSGQALHSSCTPVSCLPSGAA